MPVACNVNEAAESSVQAANDTLATAQTATALPTVVCGAARIETDVDYWKVTLTGNLLVVRCFAGTAGQPAVTIRNSAGTPVLATFLCTTGKTGQGALAAGTYYVSIQPNGAYKMEISSTFP